jgi:predicted DCC family thiol-disulfide oxidoreductase YuxK
MTHVRQKPTASQSVVASSSAAGEPTVYYDGSCPLCSREIAFYASRTGGDHLVFVDVSQEVDDPAHDLTRDDALRRFHVRCRDGELTSGALAFVEIWRSLPNWRWLAKAASFPGAVAVLEILYRGFLWIRPAISRSLSGLGFTAVNPSTQKEPPRKAQN